MRKVFNTEVVASVTYLFFVVSTLGVFAIFAVSTLSVFKTIDIPSAPFIFFIVACMILLLFVEISDALFAVLSALLVVCVLNMFGFISIPLTSVMFFILACVILLFVGFNALFRLEDSVYRLEEANSKHLFNEEHTGINKVVVTVGNSYPTTEEGTVKTKINFITRTKNFSENEIHRLVARLKHDGTDVYDVGGNPVQAIFDFNNIPDGSLIDLSICAELHPSTANALIANKKALCVVLAFDINEVWKESHGYQGTADTNDLVITFPNT